MITVPIDLLSIEDDGYHLRVEAMLNGRPAMLLLDTGASRSVFDKERIRHFIPDVELKPADGTSTGLGTNSMEGHLAKLDKLEIGDLCIRDLEIALLDLVHVNQTFARIGLMAIDGVLGSDLLAAHRAVIDYGKKELVLTP